MSAKRALEQALDKALRYGEVVGCELLNFFIRRRRVRVARSLSTVGELLHWCYANLAMAHAALDGGATAYGRHHYMVRARLFNGLTEGTMTVGSLVEDDRLKLVLPRGCCYCGVGGRLSVDHLIPTSRGGQESADNIVWACGPCNSSKGGADVLRWYAGRGKFPPLLLLRRYLKLAIGYCSARNLLGAPLAELPDLPFDLAAVPESFPDPGVLILWPVQVGSEQGSQEAGPGGEADCGSG